MLPSLEKKRKVWSNIIITLYSLVERATKPFQQQQFFLKYTRVTMLHLDSSPPKNEIDQPDPVASMFTSHASTRRENSDCSYYFRLGNDEQFPRSIDRNCKSLQEFVGADKYSPHMVTVRRTLYGRKSSMEGTSNLLTISSSQTLLPLKQESQRYMKTAKTDQYSSLNKIVDLDVRPAVSWDNDQTLLELNAVKRKSGSLFGEILLYSVGNSEEESSSQRCDIYTRRSSNYHHSAFSQSIFPTAAQKKLTVKKPLSKKLKSKKVTFKKGNLVKSTLKKKDDVPDVSSTWHQHWSTNEDSILLDAIAQEGQEKISWDGISRKYFNSNRTASQCKMRWMNNLKRGKGLRCKWSPDEDSKIVALALQRKSWSEMTKYLPGRSSNSIRERYVNILDPCLKKTPWTKEEDDILFDNQRRLGNKWTEIRKKLPGRSVNSIKNRYHNRQTSLKRGIKRTKKSSTLELCTLPKENEKLANDGHSVFSVRQDLNDRMDSGVDYVSDEVVGV